MSSPVRIGCYSAFWGDSVAAAQQLVKHGNLQYLVADYLAEVTMGILAKRREKMAGKRGGGGYVSEFITFVWKPLMADILRGNIRIVTNAGGLDPIALKEAIEQVSQEAGFNVKVAAVFGDDILDRRDKLNIYPFAPIEDESETIPGDKKIESLNAYLGAEAICKALDQGAQVVVTGRCVDSALVLGPLLHEHNWALTDYDLLAAGSLAGHIVECGCQATGGNFTDWKLSCYSGYGGWSNMGYPIVEVSPDGSFIVTKPEKTGGIVSVTSVGEQMIYEIGDPSCYILPDVIVDFRNVKLTQLGPDSVQIRGAKGRAPTPNLKVSGIYMDGYKVTGELFIGGSEAREKALAVGDAIVTRVNQMIQQFGMDQFRAINIEAIGTEHTYGPRAMSESPREVVLRLSAHHDDVRALRVFLMEIAPSATCMAPGIIGVTSGRPRPQGNMVHFSDLVDKTQVPAKLLISGQTEPQTIPFQKGSAISEAAHVASIPKAPELKRQDLVYAPLIQFCVARSGDKGDSANVGVIVRSPEFYPHIAQYLTADRIHEIYRHLMNADGKVKRFELVGINALNFLISQCLGGGGLSSLQIDRQAKTYAQILLSTRIPVPRDWLKRATL